jgi:hypothetical protein
VTSPACPACGRLLDAHNRHVRFKIPEPVLTIPEQDRPSLTWGNDVLMQVEGVGAFIRILIPVKLAGGYRVTYGAWLSVRPADLRRAWEVWLAPEYRELRVTGVLANKLPGWESETYGKPVEAAVLDVDHTPYAVNSADDFMRRVIEDEWPHEVILDATAPEANR